MKEKVGNEICKYPRSLEFAHALINILLFMGFKHTFIYGIIEWKLAHLINKSQIKNNSTKEIQITLRLFLVIAMYRQVHQFKPIQSITQPPTLQVGWEGIVGTCSR